MICDIYNNWGICLNKAKRQHGKWKFLLKNNKKINSNSKIKVIDSFANENEEKPQKMLNLILKIL